MKSQIKIRNVVCIASALSLCVLLGYAAKQATAQPPQGPVAQAIQQFQQQVKAVYATDAYYSNSLKAQLVLEKMSIPGYTFWGARVVGMDPHSPLHQIQFQLGDVITRLDGAKIGTGKYWTGSYWWLPQAERHYGNTQVRNIRSGNQFAQNDYVDLGKSCFPKPPNNIVVP